MRIPILVGALGVVAVLGVGSAMFITGREEAVASRDQGEALIGGPFSLVDQDGERVTQADFDDQYKLIYFGYTYCPDVCPFSLQVLAAAMDEMPQMVAEQVTPIFITVDPARDTQEIVKSYVELFHPRMVGLTGSEQEIDQVTDAYRVYARRADSESASEYLMDHSSFTYLMAPDGRYLTHFSHGTQPQEMAVEIEDIVAS